MPKRRKLLLQPSFLANQAVLDYERKRNERVRRNKEILNSFGAPSIATSLWGSVQYNRANENGKRSRGELDDVDYIPSDDENDHDDDSDCDLSPPQLDDVDYIPSDDENDHDDDSDCDLSPPHRLKNMKKKRYRTWNMEVGSQPNKSHNVSRDTHLHSASHPSQQHSASHPSQSHESSQPAHHASDSQPSQLRGISRPQPQPAQPHRAEHQPIQPPPAHRQEEDNFDLRDNLDDDLSDAFEVGIRDVSNAQTKRGVTRLLDIWNLPPGKKIVLDFNASCLPVGDEGGVFNRFIGTVARKPHLCPINYNSWHHVPNHYKESCWNIIESKFFILEDEGVRGQIKRNTFKSIGDKLRQWRCSLKGKYYDESKTVAQVVAITPLTVNREQFADLVNYWFSKDGQERSIANRNCRKDQNNPHTAGSKTYAQHAYELEEKDKVGVSRTMLYGPTHTKKDGTPVSEKAAENMRKMKELKASQQSIPEENMKGKINWSKNDIYSQVIDKKEHNGRVRGMGFGHTPKSCSSTSNGDVRLRVDEERMREKDTYIRDLEDKVQSQEQKLNATVSELDTVKSLVDFLIKQSGLQVQDVVASGIRNQDSSRANQGSSFASHEVSSSFLGNRTI